MQITNLIYALCDNREKILEATTTPEGGGPLTFFQVGVCGPDF